MTSPSAFPQDPDGNEALAGNDDYIDTIDGQGDDGALDPDVNDDQLDSADADYRAATEGTQATDDTTADGAR